MPDRGPIVHCRVKACAYVGYFAHHDHLCPAHRDGLHDARPPVLTEIEVTDATQD